jgi:predicted nucleic acid-binding protein
VSGVEVLSALYRRARMRTVALAQVRRMDVQFCNDLTANLQGIEPIPAGIHEAMRLISTYLVRVYDAVQLAAALYLRSQNVAAGLAVPVFIVSDHDLICAAGAEHLSTDDPNFHP